MRTTPGRLLTIAALLIVVAISWDERDVWLWVGLILLVSSTIGLVAHLRSPASDPRAAGD